MENHFKSSEGSFALSGVVNDAFCVPGVEAQTTADILHLTGIASSRDSKFEYSNACRCLSLSIWIGIDNASHGSKHVLNELVNESLLTSIGVFKLPVSRKYELKAVDFNQRSTCPMQVSCAFQKSRHLSWFSGSIAVAIKEEIAEETNAQDNFVCDPFGLEKIKLDLMNQIFSDAEDGVFATQWSICRPAYNGDDNLRDTYEALGSQMYVACVRDKDFKTLERLDGLKSEVEALSVFENTLDDYIKEATQLLRNLYRNDYCGSQSYKSEFDNSIALNSNGIRRKEYHNESERFLYVSRDQLRLLIPAQKQCVLVCGPPDTFVDIPEVFGGIINGEKNQHTGDLLGRFQVYIHSNSESDNSLVPYLFLSAKKDSDVSVDHQSEKIRAQINARRQKKIAKERQNKLSALATRDGFGPMQDSCGQLGGLLAKRALRFVTSKKLSEQRKIEQSVLERTRVPLKTSQEPWFFHNSEEKFDTVFEDGFFQMCLGKFPGKFYQEIAIRDRFIENMRSLRAFDRYLELSFPPRNKLWVDHSDTAARFIRYYNYHADCEYFFDRKFGIALWRIPVGSSVADSAQYLKAISSKKEKVCISDAEEDLKENISKVESDSRGGMAETSKKRRRFRRAWVL